MDQYLLEEVDENWNNLIITRERSENVYSAWNNDNLISSYFKISVKSYREILKTHFGELIKIEQFSISFDKSITVENIMDTIDIARVTAIMFEEEPKSVWNRYFTIEVIYE